MLSFWASYEEQLLRAQASAKHIETEQTAARKISDGEYRQKKRERWRNIEDKNNINSEWWASALRAAASDRPAGSFA